MNIAPWLGQRSHLPPLMEVGYPKPSRATLCSHTVIASTLLLNFRTIMEFVFNKTRVLEQADLVDPTNSVASSTTSKKHFQIIQPLLAALVTTGLDHPTDVICRETLGIVRNYLPSGLVWFVFPSPAHCIEADTLVVTEEHYPSSTEYVRILYGGYLQRLQPGGFWRYVHCSEYA